MKTNPRRTARQSNPFSLLNAQRGIAVNQQPLVVERAGYSIEIKRNPFWNASVNTGAPFFMISAFGRSQEDAVAQLLGKIETLKAGTA